VAWLGQRIAAGVGRCCGDRDLGLERLDGLGREPEADLRPATDLRRSPVPARRQNTLCHVPAHGYMPAQGHDTAPTSSSLMQPQRVTRKSRQVRCTSNPHVPAAGIAHATLKGPGRYEGGTLTKELPSGHQTRFHCRLTSWILWVRMCEKETDIALLARLPSSMHCLRHGCWFVLVVRAVVHDI